MRYPGKISPTKAARMLDKHVNTVRAACKAAEEGRPTLFRNVERAENGYFLLDRDEVARVRDYGEPDDE